MLFNINTSNDIKVRDQFFVVNYEIDANSSVLNWVKFIVSLEDKNSNMEASTYAWAVIISFFVFYAAVNVNYDKRFE